MRTQLITAPADEPLYLEEVRMHLRNPEVTTNDDELYRWIQGARELVEHKTGYRLLTQTWDVYLDEFPSYEPIQLPFPPLQSVTSVNYRASDGTLTAVDAGVYSLNTAGLQASLGLVSGQSWPTSTLVIDAIVIRIVVGWQDAEFVPASIKDWMLLAIESKDKQRGLSVEREPFLSPYAERLLDPYRIVSI